MSAQDLSPKSRARSDLIPKMRMPKRARKRTSKELVTGELRKVFRPEFLNRVDDIIVFNKLNKDEIKQIAVKMLKTLENRLDKMNIKISFTDNAISEIADKGFDENYGARPLRPCNTERD